MCGKSVGENLNVVCLLFESAYNGAGLELHIGAVNCETGAKIDAQAVACKFPLSPTGFREKGFLCLQGEEWFVEFVGFVGRRI